MFLNGVLELSMTTQATRDLLPIKMYQTVVQLIPSHYKWCWVGLGFSKYATISLSVILRQLSELAPGSLHYKNRYCDHPQGLGRQASVSSHP